MTPSAETLKNAIDRSTGTPEVTADWAAANRGAFRFVDVREPHELTGPLGAAEGVENLPLLNALGGMSGLDASQPTVLICRSGRRSAQVAAALEARGFDAVASVEGGMLAWNLRVLDRHDVHAVEREANTHNLGEAVYRTNGLPEVTAHWTHKNVGRFRLIDVREPHELVAVGAVAQAENIPLSIFLHEAAAISRDQPLVVMCASGGRSGRAVRALESAGFTAVASMEGGMFGWLAGGLPAVKRAA